MIRSYTHSEESSGYHLRKVWGAGWWGEATKVTVGDKLEGGCVSPGERRQWRGFGGSSGKGPKCRFQGYLGCSVMGERKEWL